jgi:hypothetical protein
MTIVVMLNIVFAAFVVIGIVGLLSASILSDRAAVGPAARRSRAARARATRSPQRSFGPAQPAR